ncbi:MAG: phosphatase PAP2 family protein [Oligoflexus sp.]|nr:phosphatase PAP2 family protein [Pseudopedobacter sp.]
MGFLNKNARQILGVIILGFIILTILVLIFPSSWVDLEFSEELQEYHNPILDFTMKAISWFGLMYSSIIIVLGSAILLFLVKKRRAAYFCFSTLLISLITYSIKVLINRPRPGKDLVRIIVDVQHQSFPSGHVSFYIAFFGFIAFILHHHKWLTRIARNVIICFCLVLILTIPVSRIYLGAHWFTDVLGGFLLGTAFLGILIMLYLKKQRKA